MLKIGLDLGGSQVRCTDGLSMRFLSTDAKEIDIKSPSNERDIEDTLLDMIIESHPNKRFSGRRFVKGDAIGFYRGTMLIQDNSSSKVEQDIVYINTIYALARYLAENKNREGEPLKLTVLIPVTEYFKKTPDLVEEFKSELAGNITVKFPMRNKTVSFRLEKSNIKVGPEGAITLGKFKELPGFSGGVKVIVDSGKDTTDITLMNGDKLLGYASVSERIGGSNIESIILNSLNKRGTSMSRDSVRKSLCSSYIIRDGVLQEVTGKLGNLRSKYPEKDLPKALSLDGYSDEDIESALHKFWVMEGAEPLDITEDVIQAKRVIAKSIYDRIKSAFDTELLNIDMASFLICLGRPFTGSVENDTCLSNMLARHFPKRVSVVQVDNPHLANALALQDACR